MDSKEKNLWLIIGLLTAAMVGYVVWSMRKPPATPEVEPPAEEGVFCTMEAKQCPDGSYVGRQGPSCEFAPCPGPSADVEVEVK